MYCFLRNRYCASKSRVNRMARSEEGLDRLIGERTYDNGAVYKGEFLEESVDGSGKLEFPDGTVIEGRFAKDRFIEGEVRYFGVIKVKCRIGFSERTQDDFMEEFCFRLASGYCVRGSCRSGGNINLAEVFDRRGNLLAVFEGKRVKVEVEGSPGLTIVVTRTWVYEGLIREGTPDTVEFGDRGTQLWTKGFGYFRIAPSRGGLTKCLLRVFKRLCVYREVVIVGSAQICSLTCYADGTFYLTSDNPNSGILASLGKQGEVLKINCRLDDVIAVEGLVLTKGGTVYCRVNQESKIEFFDARRNYRLEDLCLTTY